MVAHAIRLPAPTRMSVLCPCPRVDEERRQKEKKSKHKKHKLKAKVITPRSGCMHVALIQEGGG